MSDDFEMTILNAKYLGAVRVFVWLEDVIGEPQSRMLRRQFAEKTKTPFDPEDERFASLGIVAHVIREKMNCTKDRSVDIAQSVITALEGTSR